MEKDCNNMVSEPSIPVVACTEMTMSAAEEERCKELLAKLKDAIDRRGVMLDKLGKVMDEMVSSLATSTPLLVSGAADSNPNSTAINKVLAMTNTAPSKNATLTDQAHTRCSRSGLDTNAGDLHVVAASNPETRVPTVAPAPAEHSSAPSSKPFSATQQDIMTPTKCSTSGLDSNTGSIHVPATSLLTMAASMAIHAPKGSSLLPTVVVPTHTQVVCGMIMKFGLCKFNKKAIDRVVLNGVPLIILGLGKIEEFLGTVVRLQPWPPPAGPNCTNLLVKVDKVLGHVVDITLRWVVLQPPWPPPVQEDRSSRTEMSFLQSQPFFKKNDGGTRLLPPWPPDQAIGVKCMVVEMGMLPENSTYSALLLHQPWPPPNLTAQIKMSYPAPLQLVEMKPRRGSCQLFSSVTGAQDEFGAVLKHYLNNLLVVQNSSNRHHRKMVELSSIPGTRDFRTTVNWGECFDNLLVDSLHDRKPGDRIYTQMVKLLMIDEIYLLPDNRGPVLESIASRAVRPIEKTKEHVCLQYFGISGRKPLQRFQLMNEISYKKVMAAAGKHQVLIFGHSPHSIAKPSPEINKSRLYITNLPRSMTADKLVNLFMPFGQIRRVLMNLEYSLVWFADESSVITSVENMDGYLIEGKRLVVRRSEPCPTNAAEHTLSQSVGKPMKEIDMTNLYVGRVPSTITADQLVELFCPFGQIVQARMFKFHGYGMVRYDSPSSAAAAIDHMDGYQIGGSTLVVKVAGLRAESDVATNAPTLQMTGNEQRQIDMTNLYVCHLPYYVTTEKLIEIFLPCSQITQAKVVVDRYTGMSKGFGFVKFADPYSAAMAITHMNGYPLEGHMLEVRIAGVQPGAMSSYMAHFYSHFTSPDPLMTAVGIPTSYWPYYYAEYAYATSAENQGQGTAFATNATDAMIQSKAQVVLGMVKTPKTAQSSDMAQFTVVQTTPSSVKATVQDHANPPQSAQAKGYPIHQMLSASAPQSSQHMLQQSMFHLGGNPQASFLTGQPSLPNQPPPQLYQASSHAGSHYNSQSMQVDSSIQWGRGNPGASSAGFHFPGQLPGLPG